MQLVHTGLNGDAPDGCLGDLVHATISTVSNVAGAVLGGLRQCGFFEEDNGRVGHSQYAGVQLAELAGSVATSHRSVRFTLPQRSDIGPLVAFTTDQLSPGKRKSSAAFAAEAERKFKPVQLRSSDSTIEKRKRTSSKESSSRWNKRMR